MKALQHASLLTCLCATGAFALAACSSSSSGPDTAVFFPDASNGPAPDSGSRADSGQTTPRDSGSTMETDGGSPAPDTGTDNSDSGTQGQPDAQPPADTGSGNPDAAPANPDAMPDDTGVPPDSGVPPDAGMPAGHVQKIFWIMLENANWSDYASATFIQSLLPMGGHSENYHGAHSNGVVLHPSEPNYLYLIAGDNFGIADDNPPSSNHQAAGTPNLGSQMNAASITWKSYQEAISGSGCPLSDQESPQGIDTGHGYRPKHNPFVFFDDLTGANNPNDPTCQAHNRPMTEFFTDLAAGNLARFNLLTPDLCHDGHDSCAPQNNKVQQIDDWLHMTVPMIMQSQAYQQNGLIVIVWDECSGFLCDNPIGMIMLSPLAKTNYTSTTNFDHGSMLRTFQDILGLQPYLGGAAQATNMAEFFTSF